MQLLLLIFLLIFSADSMATDYAAQVSALSGTVSVQTKQETARQLGMNDKVFTFQTITTGDDSAVSLIFSDGSKFDLAANTQFEISQYHYEKAVDKDTFSTRIIKGTFRFVTGLIASKKPAAMNVNLPVATIGIRGTHVVAEARDNYAKIILLDPESPKDTAIEVYNQFGRVIIDKPGYGTEVPDEFSPPSPVRRMQLRTMDNLLRSIQNAQRIRVPRPRF